MVNHVKLADLGKESGHSIGFSERDASCPVVAPLNHSPGLEYVGADLVHAPVVLGLGVPPEAEGQHVLVLACPEVLGLVRLELDQVVVRVAQVDGGVR